MATSEDELKKIATLAYIEIDCNTAQFAKDMSAIMNFVGQLRSVDTTSIAPLLHPLNMHQRLRIDDVNHVNYIPMLEKIAPVFANDLYYVPKLGPFANEGK